MEKKHIRQEMLVVRILPSDLSIPVLKNTKKKKEKRMTYIRIIANTGAIWQYAAHNTDQLSSPKC